MDSNKRIAVVLISLGKNYHQWIEPMIASIRQYFLPKHHVEILLWTDSKEQYYATKFPTEDMGFPWDTLLRYQLFLSQQDLLEYYDYIFYADIDMKIVSEVGDEILGDLVAVKHPDCAFQEVFRNRFESNPESSAYVPNPFYCAGGFQGGKSQHFIKAMKSMKRAIDEDLNRNYVARWQDESHWNRYLFENSPTIVLNPSYCYPVMFDAKPPYKADLLHLKLWGIDYTPKILCFVKKHHLSKEGGEQTKKIVESLS